MVNFENIFVLRWDKLFDDIILNGEVEGKNENLLFVFLYIDWNYVLLKFIIIF